LSAQCGKKDLHVLLALLLLLLLLSSLPSHKAIVHAPAPAQMIAAVTMGAAPAPAPPLTLRPCQRALAAAATAALATVPSLVCCNDAAARTIGARSATGRTHPSIDDAALAATNAHDGDLEALASSRSLLPTTTDVDNFAAAAPAAHTRACNAHAERTTRIIAVVCIAALTAHTTDAPPSAHVARSRRQLPD